MSSQVFYFILIALLIGIIVGQHITTATRSLQPIIVSNDWGNQNVRTNYTGALTLLIIVVLLLFAAYYKLKDYDLKTLLPKRDFTPPNPVHPNETTDLDSNPLVGSVPTDTSLDVHTPAPSKSYYDDSKLYEQLIANGTREASIKARAYFEHLYPSHRILSTDLPNENGHYLCFIELNGEYDARQFRKRHRKNMPPLTKAEILPLFSQPF